MLQEVHTSLFFVKCSSGDTHFPLLWDGICLQLPMRLQCGLVNIPGYPTHTHTLRDRMTLPKLWVCGTTTAQWLSGADNSLCVRFTLSTEAAKLCFSCVCELLLPQKTHSTELKLQCLGWQMFSFYWQINARCIRGNSHTVIENNHKINQKGKILPHKIMRKKSHLKVHYYHKPSAVFTLLV